MGIGNLFSEHFEPIDLALLMKLGGGILVALILCLAGVGMIFGNFNATKDISMDLPGGFKLTSTSLGLLTILIGAFVIYFVITWKVQQEKDIETESIEEKYARGNLEQADYKTERSKTTKKAIDILQDRLDKEEIDQTKFQEMKKVLE
jgi:uncharacterized membrane protein